MKTLVQLRFQTNILKLYFWTKTCEIMMKALWYIVDSKLLKLLNQELFILSNCCQMLRNSYSTIHHNCTCNLASLWILHNYSSWFNHLEICYKGFCTYNLRLKRKHFFKINKLTVLCNSLMIKLRDFPCRTTWHWK